MGLPFRTALALSPLIEMAHQIHVTVLWPHCWQQNRFIYRRTASPYGQVRVIRCGPFITRKTPRNSVNQWKIRQYAHALTKLAVVIIGLRARKCLAIALQFLYENICIYHHIYQSQRQRNNGDRGVNYPNGSER